ncbi:unnamed protein product [Heterobilharzia americana]|nr:unnamed protein product [Heterobilharzia americana]
MLLWQGKNLLTVENRSERYTEKELKFLLREVQKYPNIIESPNNNSVTKHRKCVLWQHISHKLQNKFPTSNHKSALQLRNWWKRTKSRAKQRLSYGTLKTVQGRFNDKLLQDRRRGYLEAIFYEICEFRHRILTAYTPEKEDAEFTHLLDETSSVVDEEIFCESSRATDSDHSVRSKSNVILSEENASSMDPGTNIISRDSDEMHYATASNIYINANTDSQNACSLEITNMISNNYNISEPVVQDSNNNVLLNQIITNAVVTFLSHYSSLLRNPVSYDSQKAYSFDINASQNVASHISTHERSVIQNVSAHSPETVKDYEGMYSDGIHTPCTTIVSTLLDYLSQQNGLHDLIKSGVDVSYQKLMLEILQINNEILKLKRRKVDLEIKASEEYITAYMERLNIP